MEDILRKIKHKDIIMPETADMESPQKETPTTEQEEKKAKDSIESILAKNQERLDKLSCKGIDQKTGRGCPMHNVKVVITDYAIPEQWVTPEVAENKLYRDVAALGSIKAYVEFFNATRQNKLLGGVLTYEAVARALLIARLKRDPWFAFIVCFKIKDKKTGNIVPFKLRLPQHTLLQDFEEMRLADEPIRLVLLKARQWGGSTLTQLYMAWIQLFMKEGWNSVIVAQTKDTARRIKAMYTKVLKYFPAELIFNEKELQFNPFEKSTADSIITNQNGKVIRDNVITIASFENFESTRGSDFALVHLSEVAYWMDTPTKTSEQLITNIEGNLLVEPRTLEVLESTANGMSGYFYDECQLAKEKRSGRRFRFISYAQIDQDTKPFKSDDERRKFAEQLWNNRHDNTETTTAESGATLWRHWRAGATLEGINWYVSKRAMVHDHASIASEAPIDDIECFKHSGHTIFDAYRLDQYRQECVREPRYVGDITATLGKEIDLTGVLSPTGIARAQMNAQVRLGPLNEKGALSVWAFPDRQENIENRYITVVDVGGRHIRSDYSVITIIDRLPINCGGRLEVVARWRGHIRYDLLALKAVHLSRYYNNALLVFESNTFDKKKAEATEFVDKGDHTRGILTTIEDQYENLYLRTSGSPEDLKLGHYKKVGFQTNVKTKQDMVDLFIVAFEEGRLIIDPDERLYKEMAIYEQREDGSYGNIVGRDNHDDILMTDMIGCLVSQDTPAPQTISSWGESLKAFTDSEQNESYI